MSRFQQWYFNHINHILKLTIIFFLGLSLLIIGVHYTQQEAPAKVSNEIAIQQLTKRTTIQTATDFLNAYQQSDLEKMQTYASFNTLASIYKDESETKETMAQGFIEMFGGSDVLNEEIIANIHTFVDNLYQREIMYFEIQDTHIRDNIGKVSVLVVSRQDPTIIQEIDISKIISKKIAEYADAHQQELIDLYKESQDDNAITKKVLENIYQPILDAIKQEYQALPIIKKQYLLTISMGESGKFEVASMTEATQPK